MSLVMAHDEDPKKKILDAVGNVDDFQLFGNKVLIAIYKRPEKTKGGILLTERVRDEDNYQGKVGLIIKCGEDAFKDDTGKWFKGNEYALHDWVVFRPSDTWSIGYNGITCRLAEDIMIQGKITSPDVIW